MVVNCNSRLLILLFLIGVEITSFVFDADAGRENAIDNSVAIIISRGGRMQ